jgi:hypothetical protein
VFARDLRNLDRLLRRQAEVAAYCRYVRWEGGMWHRRTDQGGRGRGSCGQNGLKQSTTVFRGARTTGGVFTRDGHCVQNSGQEKGSQGTMKLGTVPLKTLLVVHRVSSPTHIAVVVSGAESFGRRQEQFAVATYTELIDLVARGVEPPGGRWLRRRHGSFET